MALWDTITSWWSGISAATEGTVEWFQNAGYAIASAIGQILYWPFAEIMGFLASLQYLFDVLVQLTAEVFAPITFIVNFLAGFFAAITQNYSLSATNLTFTVNAINNFVLAIPGYSSIIIVVNAMFWVLLGFHIMREIQKI